MRAKVKSPVVLLVCGVAASMVAYASIVAPVRRDGSSSDLPGQGPREGVPATVFTSTGDYAAGNTNFYLILHTFEVTPDYIAVVYTLTGASQDEVTSFTPSIVDDKGKAYQVISNTTLGSTDGVVAGILVVEPHIPGGSLLTFRVTSGKAPEGAAAGTSWSIPFLRTARPDEPITFIEGGRLSPEEGVITKGLAVAVAGPPGSWPVEVLVDKDGRTVSLFGAVDRQGKAEGWSEGEFRNILGIPGYPKPPSFPASAKVLP